MKKRIINTNLLITAILGFILLFSCNSNVLYNQAIDIPKGNWEIKSPIKFTFPITDNFGYYSIIFSIRNNNKYRYSNLFLFIDTYSPDGKSRRDTIEVSLADEKGKWLGSGVGGIWQNKFYFRKNIRFPQNGEYKINITQAMRDNSLEGIIDFGIKIVPFKQE